ncbi:MAG: hypothetical protein JXA33_21205 [Anaerolineae bacterium]|nr:hypothetical protein [Anaerolineae bacterium]
MGRRERLFNGLTFLMLGLTVVILLCYIAIAMNPYLFINPFPPPPPSPLIALATHTPLPTSTRESVPTWTPTSSPTVTPTPAPSFTPTITPSPKPYPTPTYTATPLPPTPRVTRSPYPFTYELTYQTPYYGCSWMGAAGVVQDIDGNPLTGYPIHIWGGGIDIVVNAGDNPMYGDSGWEQFFTNKPTELRNVFRVQIHSRDNPNHPPVSEEIVLDFPGYCSEAMAYIIFTQNH